MRQKRRGARWLALAFAAGTIGVAAYLPPVRLAAKRGYRAWAMRRLLETNGGKGMPFVTRGPTTRQRVTRSAEPAGDDQLWVLRAAAGRVIDSAEDDPASAARYDAAVAYLLSGENKKAIASLEDVPKKDAASWAVLAEAHRRSAAEGRQPSELRSALVAAYRAKSLEPSSPAAQYVWVATLEDFGASDLAHDAWAELLKNAPPSPWTDEVRRRMDASARQAEVADWRASYGRAEQVAAVSEERLRAVSRSHPRMARMWSESVYLAEWARAHAGGDAVAADRALTAARRFAVEVRSMSGETLLSEAVNAIDAADATHRALLARGHMRYAEGRELVNQQRATEGLAVLGAAAADLREGGSPMHEMATTYAGVALEYLGRNEEAATLLTELLNQDQRHIGHFGLRAHALHELGLCEMFLGRWSDSLAAAHASAAFGVRLGERDTEGVAHNLLASSLDLLGRHDDALRERLAAIRLHSSVGDSYFIAVAFADATLEAMYVGDRQAAAAFSEVDIAAAQKSGKDAMIGLAWLRRAQLRAGSPEEQAKALDQAKAATARIPDQLTAERMRADIDRVAAAAVRERDPRLAAAIITRTLDYYRGAGLLVILPGIYLERARMFHAAGDLAGCSRDLEEGIRLIERQHTTLPDIETRTGIYDRSRELFGDAVRVALLRSDPVGAFAMSERGRARALLDQLALPSSAATPAVAEPADVETIRQAVGGGALIELTQLPDKLVAFVIAGGGLHTIETAVTAARMEQQARELTERVAHDKPADALAAELYDLLIAPVLRPAGELDGPLVIVADGPLRELPFAALYDRTAKRYLIESHSIVAAPSAAVFVHGAKRLRDDGAPRATLLISDPAFDTQRFPSLVRLDGSAAEARSIAGLYPEVTTWKGSEATVERFVSQAPRFDVLQFSGHGMASSTPGDDPFLVLAPDATRPDDSGILYGRRIGRMRLPDTRLVVLAACGSMEGDTFGREGMPTVARSFLAAGVPAVVATLWSISDEQSAPLLVAFHRALAQGAPPDRALRTAQLQMLASGSPASVWAAFEVVGSTSTGSAGEHGNGAQRAAGTAGDLHR